MKRRIGLLLLPVVFCAAAQTTGTLSDEIHRMDNQLFDAFNHCRVVEMGQMLAPDLEFYHDTGGLTDRQYTLDSLRANCEKKLGLTRQLIEETHAVFPIKDFGAIQKGQHRFCHLENGVNDCGTFQFLHIWQRTDDSWQLVRVVSYGH